MQYKFYKYHGTGNDFVIIDNRDLLFDKKKSSLIHDICSRRFGIGADGLILLERDSSQDFKMVYFNADGNESSMCGNGGRCIVAFAKKLNIISDSCTFMAIDGLHFAEIDEENNVNLRMNDVSDIEISNQDFIMDTGSPHYVKFVKTNSPNFVKDAKAIRNSKRFKKEGINVNFIQSKDDKIKIRTFERGVEDETYACGTGCVAAAISSMYHSDFDKIFLETKGGNIVVSAKKNNQTFENIWLYGPTKLVFEGVIS